MPIQRQQSHNGVYLEMNELLELRNTVRRQSAIGARAVDSTLRGESKSKARGHGIEFLEVRPYQSGDDIRTIDWRVSARAGKPFTRLYSEERERTVYIAVDQRVNMFFGSGKVFKSVAAARQAALIGWYALCSGDRVGGIVMSEVMQRSRIGSTRRSLLQFLQSVAHANQALSAHSMSNETIHQLLQDCLTHVSTGATLVVLSDFHDVDKSCCQALAALSRKCKLLLLNVSDPLETLLPHVGSVGIGNGADTARVVIGKVQQRLYTEQRARNRQDLYNCVDQCSACLHEVSTSDDARFTLSLYSKFQHVRR
ncbi:MAG: DUF58 domain-containing protein [Granulosicoccus sp.]